MSLIFFLLKLNYDIVILVIKMDKSFQFKKKFGQNFLKNDQIINDIVNVADIKEDSLVIEVGPGAGILTKKLSKVAKQVLCYEIDTDLEDILASAFLDCPNVTVLFEDFLNANIKEEIKAYEFSHIYFVSNVPYYITTPILMKLMQSKIKFEKIVMMVQKEVGERFSALPGKRDYSSISVYLNYYYDVKKEFIVKRTEFIPSPNVDSIIISFSNKEELLSLKDEEHFFKLVKDSFKFKRKTIRNNLKNYDLDKVELVLKNYNMDLTTRAESLNERIFADISNKLSE